MLSFSTVASNLFTLNFFTICGFEKYHNLLLELPTKLIGDALQNIKLVPFI